MRPIGELPEVFRDLLVPLGLDLVSFPQIPPSADLDPASQGNPQDKDEERPPPRRHPGQSHGWGSMGPNVRVTYSSGEPRASVSVRPGLQAVEVKVLVLDPD